MADLRNDIERYWKGELSPAEMHELEKRALSDPFLADALEGAGQIPSDDLSADLALLRGQLAMEKSPSASRWIWVARIAAGLALIGIVAYLVITSNQTAPIRIAENKVAEKPSAKPGENPTAADPESGQSDSVMVPLNQNSQKPSADRPAAAPANELGPLMALQEDAANDDEQEQLPASRASGIETQPATSLPSSASDESKASGEVLRQAPATAGAATLSDKRMEKMQDYLSEKPKKVITGTVLDAEDGRGLAGVNVMVPGTVHGTITDEEGRYTITTDSLEAGLQFSFIGYENKEVPVMSPGDVNVQLNPDIAELSEVVVVGYGGEKRDDPLANPVLELASPSGGKKAFKQYLEQNLKYPEQALNNKVEGRVVVTFTVEPTGRMSNFQVVRGLGFGCEEEVIRLIQQGPKWHPTRKNTEPVTDKVKVRMKFTLPKK